MDTKAIEPQPAPAEQKKKEYVAPKFECSDICDAILAAKGNNTRGLDN